MNWRYFTVLLFVLMLVFTVIPVRDGIADVGVESIRTLDVTAGGGEKGRPLFKVKEGRGYIYYLTYGRVGIMN